MLKREKYQNDTTEVTLHAGQYINLINCSFPNDKHATVSRLCITQ